MASVNKVILVGHLGRDPELRYMPEGTAIANASVATSFRWNEKQSGEKKEETEWHHVVFRGRLAEIAGEYLRKGSQVYLEGRLRTRKWTDKEGAERYSTEVIAASLQMLGARADTGEAPNRKPSEPRQEAKAPQPKKPVPARRSKEDFSDDIPF